jgi:hypothetical protein
MLASVLALACSLPPVPSGPPGVAPIEVPAREQARVRGVVQAEGAGVLELDEVTLELACAGCGREAARVRPDLAGAFEFWGLAPGRHRLTLRVGTRTFVRELELAAGEEHAITLVVPALAAAPLPLPTLPTPDPEPSPSLHPRAAEASDLSQPLRRGGLAATIVGGTMGVGALLFATVVPCGEDGTRGADCDVDVRNTVALAMGLASAGTLTAGLVALGLGRAQRREQIAAGLVVQRGGGGLVVRMRF